MLRPQRQPAQTERKKLITACLIVVAVAAIIVGVTITLVATTQNHPAQTENSYVSVSGEIVCLPHKGNGDVQTMECAYGLRTDDNRHYALQFRPFPNDTHIGQRVNVKGALTTGSDSKYDIVGTIKVTEFTQP